MRDVFVNTVINIRPYNGYSPFGKVLNAAGRTQVCRKKKFRKYFIQRLMRGSETNFVPETLAINIFLINHYFFVLEN